MNVTVTILAAGVGGVIVSLVILWWMVHHHIRRIDRRYAANHLRGVEYSHKVADALTYQKQVEEALTARVIALEQELAGRMDESDRHSA